MNPKPTQFSKESLVIQRANKAVLARDYQAAIRLYVRILKEYPNNKEVLTSLADVYVLAGDDPSALKIFTKILNNDPSNFKALNSLSGIYRRMGKLEESLEVINSLKKRGLDKDEVEFNAGYTYKLMGKYDEAISSFYNALEKNPGDVLAYNHIGSIEDLRGNKNKALAAFSRGLQIDPNNPVLHYNTAMHFIAQNLPEKAAQHFESALKANAGWGDALNQYSDLLVRGGTEERAEELLLKNIKLNPQNTTAYNKLGQLYSRQKKYEDAEKMYLKVLEFDSENMTALSDLGTVYDKQKKYFDAAAILERLGKLQANDISTALRYAKILIQLNRLQDAAVLLKKLYVNEQNDISLLNILAQYFVRSKDFKKAYVCFKRISRIDPAEYDFLKENAIQFIHIKAFANAEQLLQTYLKNRPSDPEAWIALAKCYESMELYKKSLAALRNCLEFDKNNFAAIELLGNLSRSLTNDPEAMEIITDLLDKEISGEGNLDILLNSMETRENILNHITKSDSAEEDGVLPVEEEAMERTTQDTEIELANDDEADGEFLQLDFPAPDEERIDDYNPLDMLIREDDISENMEADKSVHFSDLLVPDMPVEYDRTRDQEINENPFDFPYSQKYDPTEEESFIDVTGTGFEPENIENITEQPEEPFSLAQKPDTVIPHNGIPENTVHPSLFNSNPDIPYKSADYPPAPPQAQTAPPLLSEPEGHLESLAAEPEPFFEEKTQPIAERTPADTSDTELQSAPENSADNADLPLEAHEEPERNSELPLNKGEESEDSKSETGEKHGEPKENAAEEESSQDNEDDLTIDEELMQQTREVLAHVFEKPPIKEFSRTFEMFNSLRGLCSYLPAVKKNEFFSDLNRVKLDYVIDRLQGKPGLLAAAEALHTRGFIQPKKEITDKKRPIKSTLAYMNSLVEELPDKGHAEMLHNKIDSVISGLEKPFTAP